MFEVHTAYLRGHGYGYCRFRAIHLASKGQRNTSLCYGYELGVTEGYKEYENPILAKAFEYGTQVGRHFAESTNLAEDTKCMTGKWKESQKYYNFYIDAYKKWCHEITVNSGLE